jgi:2-(1,2-epoxy-1,2-dihydrophenyl)acetyl-CoA isomerase
VNKVPAAEALEWGLINHVLPADELDNAAHGLANKLAAGSPGSYANIKRTINNVAYARFEEQLDLEAELQQERAESEDFASALRGFAAKH